MAKATTGKKKAQAGKSAPLKPEARARVKLPRKAKEKPAPKGKPATKKKSVASAKPLTKAKPVAGAKPATKAKVVTRAKQVTKAQPIAGAMRTVAAAAQKVVAAVKKIAKPNPSPSGGARIQAGSIAPSFELKDQAGKVLSSASLKGKPYVLYFYPKDDTSGCTREACGFRDAQPSFGKHGTRVIGVSPDSEASHAKFAGKYGLPFTLLSDPDKVLAKAYGAWGPKKNYGREYMGIIRSTFVVDASGKVKRAYYGVKVDGHVDSVLGEVAS
jgi:peroxiredoxin Q/BCP